MKPLFYSTALVLLSLLASCSGFSKYRIDELPSIEINEDFFGIWRSAQDTNKAGYLVVYSTKKAFGYQEGDKRSIKEYLNTDPVSYAKEIVEGIPYMYYVGYIQDDKKGDSYRNFGCNMSIIAGDTFLNIPYVDRKDTRAFDDDDHGYVFVRFLRLSKDSISIAVVSDPSMRNLGSSASVREKIQRNLNNRNFYKDTIHFYKVKHGDFDLDETVKLHEAGKLAN